MSMVIAPFQYILGLDGKPVDGGYVYIGTTGLNPETAPVPVYWDQELTIPAAQPIRTQHGYLVRNGTPARVYIAETSYSILVRDAHLRLVWSTLRTSATDTRISVTDFGALGDGITDDTAAIQAAFDSGATAILFPAGTYLVTGIVNSIVKTVFAGRGVKLKFKTGATPAPVFRLTCDTFSLVGGLIIDGNNTATIGFYDEGANNFDVNSLYVSGCTGDGVRCYAVPGNGTYYSTFSNLVSKNNGGNGVSVETLNSGEAGVISLTAAGSGYSDGEKTTTGGSGTGLKVTIATAAGAIVSAYVSDNGTGYTVGDVCAVSGGTGGQVTVTAIGLARANVLNFLGGQVSANGGDGFNLTNAKGLCITGVSVETNAGYAYRVTNCQNQALTVLGGWIEGNTTGGVTMDLASRGVQFYGTRVNQANPFSGTGIDNAGNIFLVDDLSGVLTKAMELIGVSLRDAYLRNAINDSQQSVGSNTLQCKVPGDAYYRYQLTNNGNQFWSNGALPADASLQRHSSGGIALSSHMITRYRVASKASNYTVLDTESNSTFNNNGASGVVTFSLPVASVGLNYSFIRNSSAHALWVDPNGTDVVRNAGTVGGAGKYLSLDTNGGSVRLICSASGVWEVMSSNGTLSFEP